MVFQGPVPLQLLKEPCLSQPRAAAPGCSTGSLPCQGDVAGAVALVLLEQSASTVGAGDDCSFVAMISTAQVLPSGWGWPLQTYFCVLLMRVCTVHDEGPNPARLIAHALLLRCCLMSLACMPLHGDLSCHGQEMLSNLAVQLQSLPTNA